MHSISLVGSALSIAALASAQAGRFFCTAPGGVGGDQALCTDPIATGNDLGVPSTTFKSDGFTPVDSQCVADLFSTDFFCGYFGATCDPTATGAATNCDNGVCVAGATGTGTCQGSFGQTCDGIDTNCLGYLYCTDANGDETTADTCGGVGSYCQDPAEGGLTGAAQQSLYNSNCATGYCNPNSGNCDNKVPVGGDCSADPLYSCVSGVCVTAADGTQSCEITGASQAAKARRNVRRGSLCPAPYDSCSLPGSKRGFECIDTTSNLEQCGACALDGGVDCTAIAGVDAVGCVSGKCEIWACAEGYAFDASSSSCSVALVV